VVKKLNGAYFVVLGSCFTVACLLLVFGCSDVLFHLMTYVMLLTCTGVPPVTLAMVMTVSRMLTSNSSEKIIPNKYEEIEASGGGSGGSSVTENQSKKSNISKKNILSLSSIRQGSNVVE
jgi:hypothetical protein